MRNARSLQGNHCYQREEQNQAHDRMRTEIQRDATRDIGLIQTGKCLIVGESRIYSNLEIIILYFLRFLLSN